MQQQSIYYALGVIFGCVLFAQHGAVSGNCFECSNGRACINETAFQMCFDGEIDKTQTFVCPAGTVCSRSQMGCVNATINQPSCRPNEGCGICDGSKPFACTSRTTFAQCNGKQLTTAVGKCPPNMLCNSNNLEICQEDCTPTPDIECKRDTPL